VDIRIFLQCSVRAFKASFGLRGAEVVIMEEVCKDPDEQRYRHDLFDERLEFLDSRHVDLAAHNIHPPRRCMPDIA